MIKTFVSYHHENDQTYREHISYLADQGAFEDCSVEVGDIDDDSATDETIRKYIRDKYLRDTQVTILLCGTETKKRKHIDWELMSSMIDGQENNRSGILVIDLPTTRCQTWHAALGEEEKRRIYPDCHKWCSVDSRAEYELRYPDMPDRIIDNLVKSGVQISVVPWDRIKNNVANLKFLVEQTAKVGPSNKYDCSRTRRKHNRNPSFI